MVTFYRLVGIQSAVETTAKRKNFGDFPEGEYIYVSRDNSQEFKSRTELKALRAVSSAILWGGVPVSYTLLQDR